MKLDDTKVYSSVNEERKLSRKYVNNGVFVTSNISQVLRSKTVALCIQNMIVLHWSTSADTSLLHGYP